MLDNVTEQLLLKTIQCDCEVDDSCLCLNFWLEVWVGQLRLEEQFELLVEFHFAVSNLNKITTSTTYNVTREQRLNDWIKLLAHIFDENCLTVFDCHDERVDEVILTKSENFQVILNLIVANPLQCLELRINEKWPTLARGGDSSVFDGDTVVWQTLVVPLRNKRGVGNHVERVLLNLDVPFKEERLPDIVNKPLAERPGEWTSV